MGVAAWAPHSPKSLEHICSMRPSALCSISHWAQILVTEERSKGGAEGGWCGDQSPKSHLGCRLAQDEPPPPVQPPFLTRKWDGGRDNTTCSLSSCERERDRLCRDKTAPVGTTAQDPAAAAVSFNPQK